MASGNRDEESRAQQDQSCTVKGLSVMSAPAHGRRHEDRDLFSQLSTSSQLLLAEEPAKQDSPHLTCPYAGKAQHHRLVG